MSLSPFPLAAWFRIPPNARETQPSVRCVATSDEERSSGLARSLFRSGVYYSRGGPAGLFFRQAGRLLSAYEVALSGWIVVWCGGWILADDPHGRGRFQKR